MGLFKRRKAEPKLAPLYRTDIGANASTETLEALAGSYLAPRYTHIPLLIPAGFSWDSRKAARPAPEHVFGFFNGKQEWLYAALWPSGSGTELMILRPGDESGQPPEGFADDWRQYDPTLASTGTLPLGALRFEAPTVPQDIGEWTLGLAGKPVTAANLDAVLFEIGFLIVLKATELFDHFGGDERRKSLFVESHGWHDGAGVDYLQRAMDDLVAEFPRFAYGLLDLPWRYPAMLLDTPNGNLWRDLPDKGDEKGVTASTSGTAQEPLSVPEPDTINESKTAISPQMLSQIGRSAFSGPFQADPDSDLVDPPVMEAMRAAGYPNSGTPEHDQMTDSFLSSIESASTQTDDWGQVGSLFLAYNLILPEHYEHPAFLRIAEKTLTALDRLEVPAAGLPLRMQDLRRRLGLD